MHSASFGRIYEKTGSMPVLTAGSQVWGAGIPWIQSLLLHLEYRSLCLECPQHLMSAKALRGHNFRNRSRIIHNERPSLLICAYLGVRGLEAKHEKEQKVELWKTEKFSEAFPHGIPCQT